MKTKDELVEELNHYRRERFRLPFSMTTGEIMALRKWTELTLQRLDDLGYKPIEVWVKKEDS